MLISPFYKGDIRIECNSIVNFIADNIPTANSVNPEIPFSELLQSLRKYLLVRTQPMKRADVEKLKGSITRFKDAKPQSLCIIVITLDIEFWENLISAFEDDGKKEKDASKNSKILVLNEAAIKDRTLGFTISQKMDFVTIFCGNHLTVATSEYDILIFFDDF